MKNALFLSPHLDDVAFSCSGTLIWLLQNGWSCHLITIFTQSVPAPKGFALECQTSKGLAPEADYMKLRRAEDAEFCRVVGLESFEHWNFAEAPHRGYDSAPELFAGLKSGDDVWRDVAEELAKHAEFDRVFAPQGCGNHADHLHVIRGVLELGWAPKTWFYRDTPYVVRAPDARFFDLLPRNLNEVGVSFDEAVLNQKITGSQAYASQINFQFGGAPEVARTLRALAQSEAKKAGSTGFAERFLRL